MKKYLYYLQEDIRSTEPCAIIDEHQQQVGTVQRVYRNGLMKIVDGYFDYRYFLTYDVRMQDGGHMITKKKVRRGKLWYECVDGQTSEKYIISYQNWRIGVPELFITQTHTSFKMNIDKEMEGWSRFFVEGQEVARWQAIFDEEAKQFLTLVEIEAHAPMQQPAFYISIAQAALFIGV